VVVVVVVVIIIIITERERESESKSGVVIGRHFGWYIGLAVVIYTYIY